MKLKTDFVTNSSSTCYTLVFDETEYAEFNNFIGCFRTAVSSREIKINDDEYYTKLDQAGAEDHQYAIIENQLMVEVDVSDELGHALIECTKFHKNIILAE